MGQSVPERIVGAAGPPEPSIEELTAAAEREARKRPDVLRLMTHPGVGALTALASRSNCLLRFLLVEAAQAVVRTDLHWRRRYIHLAMLRHKSIVKVAMGRRTATRLHWMWRNRCDISPSFEFSSHAGKPETSHDVK